MIPTAQTETLIFGIAAVPAIIGLVQVGKDVGMPVRFGPLLAVALGIAAGMAEVYASNWLWINGVFLGVALGLSASGLYSGVRTVIPTPDPAPTKLNDVAPPFTHQPKDPRP